MVISSPSQAGTLARRDRLIILACIVLSTLLSWAYLVHLDRQMSAGMEHDKMMAEMGMTMDMPWSAADIFFTIAMWIVMMVGMMASVWSLLLLSGGCTRRRCCRLPWRLRVAASAARS